MNAASWLEGLPAHERWRALAARRGPAHCHLDPGAGARCAGRADRDGSRRCRARAGAQPAGAPPRARAPHSLDLAAITNAHLFGAAPAARQDGANAPQTNMPLVLTGTIAGNDPQNGLAILGQTRTDRQSVCSRRQRSRGGEAAFRLQRPRSHRPQRAARVARAAAAAEQRDAPPPSAAALPRRIRRSSACGA